MFDWGVLKRGVPNSVRFCIGDLQMYIFFIPTHPWAVECTHLVASSHSMCTFNGLTVECVHSTVKVIECVYELNKWK